MPLMVRRYMADILAFSGSARKGSYNQKLVQIAALGAQQAGAELTVINMADYPLPIFNQDIEKAEGLPQQAQSLKQLFSGHDGFLIASPEYNSAFSPLLKNAIDWVSRREGDETYQLAFRDKVAVIMSTSPGALGGLRGLVFLRMLLGNIGITVLPDQQAVAHADKAFHADGHLLDNEKQAAVIKLGMTLAQHLKKLK
jgi:chromate reductase, NAD(P)H dehydrogenase (quinone)